MAPPYADGDLNIARGAAQFHWREDGWIVLDPEIVAHPYVEESKEYAQKVTA